MEISRNLVMGLSLGFISVTMAGGSLDLSTSRGFKAEDIVSTSISLGVSEKLMRKLFYSGSIGYSTGFNAEYDKTNGSFFSTNQGVGYNVSDNLSFTLGIGIGYDDHAKGDGFSERARFSASYKLWE
jgi:hypothetical protein